MVIGYHLIISAYGFWLPNDPRGSWSEFVHKWDLLCYGRATKVTTRESVAGIDHDREAREAAKEALEYPPVLFTGIQARAIGNGFATYVKRSGATIWACSILEDHIHLVIARHRYQIEQIANLMKGDATRQLVAEGHHPLWQYRRDDGTIPCCWARKWWKVFVDNEEHLLNAIRYVENNPLKEGKRRQKWSFVVQYPLRYGESQIPV